jgi:hypothetical protein
MDDHTHIPLLCDSCLTRYLAEHACLSAMRYDLSCIVPQPTLYPRCCKIFLFKIPYLDLINVKEGVFQLFMRGTPVPPELPSSTHRRWCSDDDLGLLPQPWAT